MPSIRAIVAALFLGLTASAQGVTTLQLYNEYFDFTERGAFFALIAVSEGRLDCHAPVDVQRAGSQITLTVSKVPGAYVQDPCAYQVTVRLGPLPVGDYEATAKVVAADGATYESVTQKFKVLTLEGRCNPRPDIVGAISVVPKVSADAFIARLQADAQYSARLGNPVVRNKLPIGDVTLVYLAYPPLIDPPVILDRLNSTGDFLGTARNDGQMCFMPSPPPVFGQMVEFHNRRLDHYFYTADASEIAAIEAGNVGPDWSRTGKQFTVTRYPYCGDSRYTVAYRFAGIPGKGPDSHFFTRDRAECYVVDKTAQWLLEGIPFWARAPEPDGTCAGGGALYRAWRPFGVSNHRFSDDPKVMAEMVAKGWVNEGVAMCL